MKKMSATAIFCYAVFLLLVLVTYLRLKYLVEMGRLTFDRTMIAMIVIAVLAFIFVRPNKS